MTLADPAPPKAAGLPKQGIAPFCQILELWIESRELDVKLRTDLIKLGAIAVKLRTDLAKLGAVAVKLETHGINF